MSEDKQDILAAFGQLVQSIVPGATRLCVFSAAGSLRWAGQDAATDDYRCLIDAYRAGSDLAHPASRVSGAHVQCVLPITSSERGLAGWLALTLACESDAATGDCAGELAVRLAALLKILSAELSRRLEETRQFGQPQASIGTGLSHDPMNQLLTRLLELMDAAFVLFSLPSHHFERLHARPDAALTCSDELRAVTSAQIRRLVQQAGKPLLVNRSRLGQDAAHFRFASVGLGMGDSAVGTLTAFSAEQRPPLTIRHVRLLRRAAPRLRELVEQYVDAVTGLPTRAALEHYVGHRDRESRCVVYLDLDRMHAVNELFGFASGDRVLRRVAGLWPDGCVLQDGLLARHAGDSFVAILDRCTLNHARSWAESARARIEALQLPDDCRGFKLTASLGVAQMQADDSFETALSRASTACRAAKDRGRNRVTLYSEDDRSLVQRQDDLHFFRQIIEALESKRFNLLAQPIVPLGDPRRMARFEILVRLIDRHGRELPPAKFLSAAHRYQLLPQVDRGVLERALAEIRPFVNLLQQQRLVCWINVAGSSIAQSEFVDYVRTAIKTAQVPGECLGFEITESAAIGDLHAARHFIRRVRELGCRIALDDFGTGFSSLAYLKSLAVHAIKIDGSFVRDLLSNTRSEAMVVAVLDIAQQLDLETVAEFVEDSAVANRLRELGVTYGQGYLYSQPLPLGELLRGLEVRAGEGPGAAGTRSA